jgi:prepilin-type N-terminal cleavage/methylation domain-containing protein
MRKRGFTLIEIIIVVAVILILSALVTVSLYRQRSQAKLSRVSTELTEIASALNQYADDNGYQYPPDSGRGVPPGLERYLVGGKWPAGGWPHGVYDYDNWLHPGPGANTGKQIYQISYRLCSTTDPIEYCSDPVLFPQFTRNSAIIYCISGPCIPHQSDPLVPAYCVNCTPKKQNY